MGKKVLFGLILLFLLPILLSMGSLQTPSVGKIPIPAKKFSVTFMDEVDVATDCQEASIDGETFLEGRRGEGMNAIPFDNIAEISFLAQNGGKLIGAVKLRDGAILQLALNRNQTAYGRTKYGIFQIKLSKLKKMIIGKPSQRN